MYTYGDLKNVVNRMTDLQLSRPVQVLPPHTDGDKPIELHAVLEVAAILVMCGQQQTRSSYDNQHHPEDIILLTDLNPFDPDGAIAEDLGKCEKIYLGPLRE